MLYVNIVILLLYTVGYVASINGDKEWKKTINKKEHKLYMLYPMANKLLEKTGLYKVLYRQKKVVDSIKALNVTSKPETIQKLYWCGRISLAIAMLFLFHLFSLMGQMQYIYNSKIVESNYILRPNSGEGNDEVELSVDLNRTIPANIASKKGADNYSADIKVRVEERSYTDTELEKVFEEAVRYLDICMLGSNESAEYIYKELYFCDRIPGTSVLVKWNPRDLKLVKRDGTVNNDDIDSKGIITSVGAVLSYRETHIDYEKQLRIMPKNYSEKELLLRKLEKELEASSINSDEKERLELPKTLEGYGLTWRDKNQRIELKILLLGIFAVIMMWLYGDKELDEKMKKRKDQMLMDYPEIINKFTLLVNAGMTVKQAWTKIAQDYEKKAVGGQLKKRYAYEEMLVTVHELKIGIPEINAYEQFGRRVGLFSFMKLSSLITQNLKKGNKGLSELLTKEATEAFEERKEAARRLGEEAGTKLLVPMMIMLLIVFIIILIPAFLSFKI